jgi:hypothetical protein
VDSHDSFLRSPWFPLAFVGLLIFFIMITPALSGWRRLATSFPDRKDLQNPEEVFSFQSLRLTFGSYSGIIKAGFFKEGLRLSVYFPVSISHKAIFIPYKDFSAVEVSQSSGSQCRAEAHGTSILFMGASAEALIRRLKAKNALHLRGTSHQTQV